MTVAFGQAKISAEFASVSSGSVTFDSPTTTGGAIDVSVSVWNSSPPSGFLVEDNKSNTSASIAGGTQTQHRHEAHCFDDITGGSGHQVTVTPGGTGNYMTINIIEITGNHVTLDDSNIVVDTVVTGISTGDVTPTADGLAVASIGINGTSDVSEEAGWDMRAQSDENFDASGPNCTATKSVSSGVAEDMDWTFTGGSQPLVTIIRNYIDEDGGGGGGGGARRRRVLIGGA